MNTEPDIPRREGKDMRTICPHCKGTEWLEPIGPCADGSYITSRPCTFCHGGYVYEDSLSLVEEAVLNAMRAPEAPAAVDAAWLRNHIRGTDWTLIGAAIQRLMQWALLRETRIDFTKRGQTASKSLGTSGPMYILAIPTEQSAP